MPTSSSTVDRRLKVTLAVFLILLTVTASNAVTFMLTRSYFMQHHEGFCTTVDSKKICSGELVGLSEEGANTLTKEKGFNPVIVSRDGKGIFHTFEGDPLRVSLYTRDNFVTKVEFYR